jgi:hypothetical protein
VAVRACSRAPRDCPPQAARAELEALPLSELRRRCLSAGAPPARVDKAMDAGDPRGAVLGLATEIERRSPGAILRAAAAAPGASLAAVDQVLTITSVCLSWLVMAGDGLVMTGRPGPGRARRTRHAGVAGRGAGRPRAAGRGGRQAGRGRAGPSAGGRARRRDGVNEPPPRANSRAHRAGRGPRRGAGAAGVAPDRHSAAASQMQRNHLAPGLLDRIRSLFSLKC